MSLKIDDYEHKFKNFESRIKTLEKDKEENFQLKAKVELLEQRNRQCNIELQQVPEKPNKNLLSIVKNIYSSVYTPFNENQIISIHINTDSGRF